MSDLALNPKRWALVRTGCTRVLLLAPRWAIKVPRFDRGWRAGLVGLLGNLQEAEFGRNGWHQLCPVTFAAWGGFLLVMLRARPLGRQAWFALDYRRFVHGLGGIVEEKICSFGIHDGRIVAVDYGS